MGQLGTYSNSGLSFGVAFTLEDGFSGVSNRINSSMEQLGSATDRIADKINSSFSKIAGGVAMVGTGIALLSPILKGINVAAGFETYEAQLTTLLKSRQRAAEVLANIKQDAKDNPVFGTDELIGVNTALISQRMEAERARGISNALAAAVAGGGGGNAELARLGTTLQQIMGKGAVDKMDMKEFANARVNMYQLMSDASGKSMKELQEASNLTINDIEKALLHAVGAGGALEGALERAAATTKGQMAQAEDAITFGFQAIGDAVKPMTSAVLGFFNKVMDKIIDFANTPFGKVAIQIGAVVLGVLALTFVMIGLVMIVEVLVTVVGALLIELLPIILAIILVAAAAYGLYKALHSTNPLLVAFGTAVLIATGPLGALVAAVLLIRRALKAFDEYLEKPMDMSRYTPLQRFFIKFGALLRAIGEMFMFSNAKDGIGMSEQLTEALRKMGLLETARNIGTWIVRLKEFWAGLKEGIKQGWNVMKTVFNTISDAFSKALEKIGFADGAIGKTTSSLEKWRKVGLYVGYALMAIFALLIIVLVGMAVTFIISGIAMFLAFLPVLLVIAVVILAIWGIVWVINHLGQAWDWVCQQISDGWNWVLDQIWSGITWLLDLPSLLFDMGANMIINMWEGIKSMWGGLKSWFIEAFQAMWDMIPKPIRWLAEKAADGIGIVYDSVTGLFGGDEEIESMGKYAGENAISPSYNTPYGNSREIGYNMATGRAAILGASNPVILNNKQTKLESITVKNYMDSEEISRSNYDKNRLREARRNDDD